MSGCFAYGCNHRAMHDTCKFFRFPIKDKKKLKIWTEMCRRSDTDPKNYSRLCSCHFKDGIKENGPTIFTRNEESYLRFVNPEKRKRERLVVEEGSGSAVDDSENLPTTSAEDFEQAGSFAHIERSELEKKISEMDSIIKELDMKVKLLESELQLEKQKPSICRPGNVLNYSSLKSNANLLRYYTGLPDAEVFDLLVKWLNNVSFKYFDKWNVKKLSMEDQLLLTLMKLRLNSDFTDLAVRFQVDRSTVRNVFITLIHVLHKLLFPTITMPSTNKNQSTCLTSAFSIFSNCRCIVDCTEIECAVPNSSLEKQSKTFSHYKQRNTMKGLVACSPHGALTFVSSLYPGSTSDTAIFRECGITHHLNAGDLILADKGFLIADLVPSGVSVNIPPFLSKCQLIEAEAKATTEIARARIHIERIIGRMKNYNILDYVSVNLRKYCTIIFQVVASLINFHHPLVSSGTGDNIEENEAEDE